MTIVLVSKSHAWYYRWNERPPPGLIIRPGSPLIYRLSRTSPLLLLLHSFIICWTTQTSSLLFFLSTSTSLFRTDPGCKFHSTMVAWCITGQCLLFPPASWKCTIRFCRSGASAFLRQSVHVGTLLARAAHTICNALICTFLEGRLSSGKSLHVSSLLSLTKKMTSRISVYS